ncbi:M20/M25/M40 family metallo-hydrolase [candidate division KSB1 bacterium]
MRISRKLLLLIFISIFINSGLLAQVAGNNPEISREDIMYHIMFLASDELGGRKAGTDDDMKAAAYIAGWFENYGLKPVGEYNSYFQPFEFTGGVETGPDNKLTVATGDRRYSFSVDSDYIPYGFSANGRVSGDVIFAGYGITSSEDNYDDYNDIDVEGKVVIVFDGSPDIENKSGTMNMYSSPRFKAITAANQGAAVLIIINSFSGDVTDELPELKYDQMSGRTGIPVVHVHRNVAENIFTGSGYLPSQLEEEINRTSQPKSFDLPDKSINISTELVPLKLKSQNVLGLIEGSDPELKDRMIVIGAHYDHIGLGGENSTAPSLTGEVHNGADDNASGTAGIMELAQKFSQSGSRPRRTILFIAFGAEEAGLLGSNNYVENPVFPVDRIDFMINFDMIGRMEENTLMLNGSGSSPVWKNIADEANEDYNFEIKFSEGALGGSDHTAFYTKEIPVLFFFTGTHLDYHKPSDDFDKIDADGEVRILEYSEELIKSLDSRDDKIAYTRVQEESQPSRRSFRVTLGVVPDFSGGEDEGFKITDVSPGGPAEKAGMKAGDTIIKLAGKEIKNIYDYMYMLGELKEGEEAEVVIKRGDKEMNLKVVLEKRKR